MATALFNRYNVNTNTWEFIRKIDVPDEKIIETLATHPASEEVEKEKRLYRYECKNSAEVSLGTIYTSNNNLFD